MAQRMSRPWRFVALALAGMGALWAAWAMFLREPEPAEAPVAAPRVAAVWPLFTPQPDAAPEQPASAAAAAPREAPLAPKPPPSPARTFNFDRAGDLYALATRSVDASDGSALYNGWLAVQVCMALRKPRGQYEQLAAAGRTPQAVAAQEMLRRCLGFFNNDAIANAGLARRFKDKLVADPSRYFGGVSTGEASQAQVDAVLAAQDWVSWMAMRRQLTRSAGAALGVAAGSPQEQLVAAAWLQASCDVGRDCSGQDAGYLAQCADTGRCQGSAEADMARRFSASQQEQVRQYRERIAQAFLSQDKRFFHIAGNP